MSPVPRTRCAFAQAHVPRSHPSQVRTGSLPAVSPVLPQRAAQLLDPADPLTAPVGAEDCGC
ncbi:hypothetical protein [Streptomyces sp. NPDC059788]|uniref:hypothetical protein n=1 Tax=Streptomyces sp. NPDC059788 TaxID=3346948 RepID=UPI00365118CD